MIVLTVLIGLMLIASFFTHDIDPVVAMIVVSMFFVGLTWGFGMHSDHKNWVEEVPRDSFSVIFTEKYCIIEKPNGNIEKLASYEEVVYWKDSTNLANAVFFKNMSSNYYKEIDFDSYGMCSPEEWKKLPKGEIVLNQ